MSLSELSGDAPTQRSSLSGYSRFGLNEHPPAHQMHTRVRRRSSASGKRPRRLKNRFPVISTVLLLFAFGVAHGRLMNCHLPQGSETLVPESSKVLLMVLSGLLTTLAGFLVSDSDTQPYREWWASFVRGYGAVLGLLYLARHLPARSIVASLLVNPSMWYIGDTTINGFLTATLLAGTGSLLTCVIAPSLVAQLKWSQVLLNLSSVGSSYFGASLLAGNLGRGLTRYFSR